MSEVTDGTTLAAHLVLSRQRHHALIREGVLPPRGPNGFPIAQSREMYIRHLRAQASAYGRSLGPHARRDGDR
jgi:hypothetical protein